MNGNTLKKLPFIIFFKKIEKKFGLLKKCLYLCIVKQIKQDIVQLVVRRIWDAEVVSSNLAILTTEWRSWSISSVS